MKTFNGKKKTWISRDIEQRLVVEVTELSIRGILPDTYDGLDVIDYSCWKVVAQ